MRGGPSTGNPTHVSQGDVNQARWGTHGDHSIVALSASNHQDVFRMTVEAFNIAETYRTPVILLSDGYIANGSEPWRLPDVDAIPAIPVEFHTDPENFLPYARDPRTLARPWAIPGTPGLEHRVGGLEKKDGTGNIHYTPENNEHMVHLRPAKIAAIAQEVRKEIQTAVDAAEAKMKTIGDPLAMFDHAYAEITPDLQTQREAFLAEQATAAKEGSDA